MNSSDKLKELLIKRNIKVSDLSRMTDIPASTIYNAINRNFKKMDIKHLSKIANALDTSMDYLVDDEITDPKYGKGDILISLDSDESDIVHMPVVTERTEGYPSEAQKELEMFFDYLEYKYKIRKGE